ncbi:Retrovirus-related Pol polyprotein from transposon TNT 1-94 [Senna tora]|uniref:Retrovirus-related Pol polyprotein from transposon TNT 1-94 n=1 Tax=Senna tora TaxID=362788 RepID=A0A835CHW0_9FABA|nr:Retrovirus-related Pol polyprotein from transposon TNT 1-94 [Senna tora]
MQMAETPEIFETLSASTGVIVEPPKFTPQGFAQVISNKLDDFNFLTWKMQVVATVKGFNLYKFLVDGKAIPPRFKTDSDKETEEIKPDFVKWECQDQVIMAWMLNSMTDAMANKMERQLRTQLRSTKKNGTTMSEFMLKIKKLADSLAAVGSPITEHEYVETISYGLPSEYEGFITSFSLRSEASTITVFEALLLTHESRLEMIKTASDNVSANLGTRQEPAWRPWFNQAFTAATLAQAQAQYTQNSYTSNAPSQSQPRPPSNASMEALVAAPETLYDSAWYPDSGASHHITHDSSNMQTHHPYVGTDQDNHQILLRGRMCNGLYVFDDLTLGNKLEPPIIATVASSTLSLTDHLVYGILEWATHLCKLCLYTLFLDLLKAKSYALLAFKQFKVLAEKQFHTSLLALQSDFGGEYLAFIPYLREQASISYPHVDPPPNLVNSLPLLLDSSSITHHPPTLPTSPTPPTPSRLNPLPRDPPPVPLPAISPTPSSPTMSSSPSNPTISNVLPSSQGGLILTQSAYIKDLLAKAGLTDSKPQPTPMVSSLKLRGTTDDPFVDPTQYRSIVGALQYTTITRPEISFSVNKVCQFMHNPQNSHWQAVKRILR